MFKKGVLATVADTKSGKFLIDLDKSARILGKEIKELQNDITEEAKIPRGKSRTPEYGEAKTIHEVYKAKIAEAKYKTLIGELVNVELLEDKFFETGKLLTEELLNATIRIANKVVMDICPQSNPREIEIIIRDEITKIVDNVLVKAQEEVGDVES